MLLPVHRRRSRRHIRLIRIGRMQLKLETVSIAELLQNRQHVPRPICAKLGMRQRASGL